MGPRGTVGNQPCSGRCAQVACTVPVEWRVEHIVLRHAEPRGTNHVLRDARRWLVLDGLEPLALRHAETRGTNHVLGDAHRWLVQFLLNGEWSISSFAMRNRGNKPCSPRCAQVACVGRFGASCPSPRGNAGNQPCSGRCAQVACTVPVEWRVEHIVLRHAEPREQTMFSAMRAGGLCWTVWSLLPFATRKR